MAENAPEGESRRRLWADQICINQKDVEEKNSQVVMMGDIYRNARRTLIWIGQGDEDVTAVVELLHAMATPEVEYGKKLDGALSRDLEGRVEKRLFSQSGRSLITAVI